MADGTWDFYFTHDGQAPMIVALDLAFGEQAPHGHLPERLIVSVPMHAPMVNGLRGSSEAPALFALEERLGEMLGAAGWVRVGRVVTRGRTDFLYYGPVGELPQLIGGEYALSTVAHADASWDLYRNFLWPGGREWQQMQNRRGTLQLRQGGDLGREPRPIEHQARALEEDAVTEAGHVLTGLGFAIGALHPLEEGWILPFSRTDPPARIDAITAEIFDVLEGQEGLAYAGWSCALLAPPASPDAG